VPTCAAFPMKKKDNNAAGMPALLNLLDWKKDKNATW
jgi:hypothetical protein